MTTFSDFIEGLLDRDGAAALMKIDRGHCDALVHEKRIVPISRFTDGASTSDQFDPGPYGDCSLDRTVLSQEQ